MVGVNSELLVLQHMLNPNVKTYKLYTTSFLSHTVAQAVNEPTPHKVRLEIE